jgi:hypothetical protein
MGFMRASTANILENKAYCRGAGILSTSLVIIKNKRMSLVNQLFSGFVSLLFYFVTDTILPGSKGEA